MEDNDLKYQVQKALNNAFFYLKFRPRSEKEVKDYLIKKAQKFFWPEEVVQQVLFSLKEKQLIDDVAFVEWFVEQRNAGKPKSQFALRHELQKFGIDREVVENFFQENPSEELELAYKALQPRWRRYQYLDKNERFKKAASFLSGKGFIFETIKKTIQKLEETT